MASQINKNVTNMVHIPNEQEFEALIEQQLVGTFKEERIASGNTNIDEQQPNSEQFYWGIPSDFDKKFAIDKRRLFSFLRATQDKKLKKYVGNIENDLPVVLDEAIRKYGILHVLRKGIDCGTLNGKNKINLFYAKPSAASDDVNKANYAKNQFSVTRQQTFSIKRSGLEIDMVIYVNGLPIFTIELKNPFTGQTAKIHGQAQYKSEDRSPKEPLLNFGRCLAHFTVDQEEIYFTTKLAGEKTYFMPFNKGLENGKGAGNPVNPNGYKTDYFWKEILRKDVISDIISNYSLFDYEKDKPKYLKYAEKLIFPRYHQLDVVNKLSEDVSENGVGKRYLIQHSAGSGKSNSITWLSFNLLKVCAKSEQAHRSRGVNKTLFDNIILVTDRCQLDDQLYKNILQFCDNDPNFIKRAEKSSELKEAILNGTRLISTTVQKFPFICGSIKDVSDHNFAIIIDEAHSSQSGTTAAKMNNSLGKSKKELTDSDIDDLIEKLVEEDMMNDNCSYFAFTATPKEDTLKRFGIKKSDEEWVEGEWLYKPFHLYSMRQAIDEGFILNVLKNYTTIKSYYNLIKVCEGNPEYKNGKAQKALKEFVEQNEETIARKAKIMYEDFKHNVINKLNEKAKAIVATQNIECAIKYYVELNKLLNDKNDKFKILIAFTGSVEYEASTLSESMLNGFSSTHIADYFDKDEYRILVVAKKFLTGFDQPKLCAMYIDKKLEGVIAVQALSRLNRTAPSLGKKTEDLRIIDFYNSIEKIQESFDPYYTSTVLNDVANINILNILLAELQSKGVYTQDDANKFARIFVEDKVLSPKCIAIVQAAAQRFNVEINWENNTAKADYKAKVNQFITIYSRERTIIGYANAYWEKNYWFLDVLVKLLDVNLDSEGIKDLLSNVDLSMIGIRYVIKNDKIELSDDEGIVDPTNTNVVEVKDIDDHQTLENILEIFRKKWFTGWLVTPEEQKIIFVNIAEKVQTHENFYDLVEQNTNADEKVIQQQNIIDNIVLDLYNQYSLQYKENKGNKDIEKQYKKISDLYFNYENNEDFKFEFSNIVNQVIANPNSL